MLARHPILDIDADAHRECKARIELLEWKVSELQWEVIHMLPEKIAARLTNHLLIENKDDYRRWCQGLIDFAIELAEANVDPSYENARAFCPLCGRGSIFGGHSRGFMVPNGLFRHLQGESRTPQCSIITAAWELAAYALRTKSHAYEQTSH